MTSFAIPARTVSKGKQSTGCDGEVAAYLLSIWAENMQMQEGDISSELLFQFASIDLGEFEMVLDFVDSFQDISLLEAATILWTQACRTLEKLQKEDMELAQQKVLQKFVNRCIQQYAFLNHGAQCGIRNLRKYLHTCVSMRLFDD